jgi:uncharacterized protein
MRWQGDRESSNVEDDRGQGYDEAGMPGGGFQIPLGGGGKGGIGIVGFLILLALMLFFGVDPSVLFQNAQGPSGQQTVQTQSTSPQDDEQKKFVSVVLADTEDVWTDIFKQHGMTYRDPHLVLYTGQIPSACGLGQAAMGPFYCPNDEKIYLDLSFFQELKNRFQAPGDFAEAYVIAHEVGHHVQKLLGTLGKVEQSQQAMGQTQANALQVRVELQADCFAGIWANHAQAMKNILEPGDIESALNAASAIGDDRLQKETQGYVVPDSFTHGTSAMRVRWFRKGFEGGKIADCDTFDASSL